MSPDDLHITRQGPPRSGEVIITDEEKHGDDPAWKEEVAYTRIARRFFAEFLQMKTQLDRGELTLPKGYEKERRDYQKLIETLKRTVKEAATDNQRLEDQLAASEEEKTLLRGRVNELTIELGLATEKLAGLGLPQQRDRLERGVPFTELMDPESRKLFETLMKEIPYQGRKDTP